MSKRVSHGGGESSLGYLFGSKDKNPSTAATSATPVAKPVVYAPPYGIDTGEDEKEETPKPPPVINPSPNFRNQKASNSTGRPSTKVKSVPGGNSSLGYLFGDKS